MMLGWSDGLKRHDVKAGTHAQHKWKAIQLNRSEWSRSQIQKTSKVLCSRDNTMLSRLVKALVTAFIWAGATMFSPVFALGTLPRCIIAHDVLNTHNPICFW